MRAVTPSAIFNSNHILSSYEASMLSLAWLRDTKVLFKARAFGSHVSRVVEQAQSLRPVSAVNSRTVNLDGKNRRRGIFPALSIFATRTMHATVT